ncbi:ribosomal L28e/Mak16 [Boletus edulis]|uniref:Ribosomal L28e/Mak16 n=1 Tax=Boletus edulis BED1 TaxID=1328754 RepID=A0AAD4BEI6_BOLED|nr:ribosomal L28e/Mak16 [Boletus edulis]KAF8423748.1 ribosomal L28e/Mak16 [Boletus edulis BED1]
MSNDLEWLLLRKYNSFLVKKASGGPIFSTEPGNLRNLHSHKYSGLANAKTIDIKDSPSGIQVTVNKSKATLHQVRGARTTSTIRNRSGGRRSLGVVAGLTRKGYRPDLRAAALARTSALITAQKEKKSRPPKKARGKKATA